MNPYELLMLRRPRGDPDIMTISTDPELGNGRKKNSKFNS